MNEVKSEKTGKKRISKKTRNRCILVGAITFLILTITFIALGFYYFGGMKITNISKNLEDLGISDKIESKYKNINIINIAIFGIDSRNNDHVGRSDSLMLLSVDREHNKLKITSIARDTKVNIPTKSGRYDKINHAYAFGGAPLAIKTLNKNFDMNIKDYVTVNFSEMASVIDAVGGVTVEITELERIDTNNLLLYDKYKELIQSYGKVDLNGAQALEYSRIRKRDSDPDRMSRQRKVIDALYEKIKKKSYLEYPSLIKQIIPMIETSLSYNDIISLVSIMKNTPAIEEKVFPNEKSNAKGGISPTDGVWYFEYDLKAATRQLHEFIYEQAYTE